MKSRWSKLVNHFDTTLIEGRERLDGDHHARLGIEQLYGYMVFDEVIYGILTTFNSFVIFKRQSPGVLHMSRMIPNTSTTPTILKLLYYISHLCALDATPHPELNSEGKAVHLKKAPTTADKAPKIPDPAYVRPERSTLRTIAFPEPSRRSPRFQQKPSNDTPLQNESLNEEHLHLDNLTSLGCKGWRGKLNGLTVFVKLWDGWKFSSQYCEHEASVYYQLQDLWGSTIPEFLGMGRWGFSHILLLSFIEVQTLYRRY
jgi:hypothetical protein